MSDFKKAALDQLRDARKAETHHRAIVGLDGFVDTIVTPVAQRSAPGEDFEPIRTMTQFSDRIAAAAGKSTNIELYPRMDKLGGNGPIMANALHANGADVTYIGALGRPVIHPVFQAFSEQVEVFSLCEPATTTAVEFQDGKLMLGQCRAMDQVTYDEMVSTIGEKVLKERVNQADLIALVNWTMVTQMTDIMEKMLEGLLEGDGDADRVFFFDLADPEKRSSEDLLEVLNMLKRFEAFGQVSLGLNLKEAQRVGHELGLNDVDDDEASLRELSDEIRKALSVSCVIVHPRHSAACATADGTYWVPGPYTDSPKITTGAGDHFNAGFARGQMLGLDPMGCLSLGVCTSGFYVRTAESPTLDDLDGFLADWSAKN